jgi:hypothetical protein
MDDLLALARAEQEHAKAALRRRLYAHALTLAVTIAALFVDEPGTYVLATIAVVSEAVAWTLRWRGIEGNDLAERARRRAMIAAALGTDPDPTGTAALRTDFSRWAIAHVDDWRDPDYWSSDLPPGPARLRDTMQESAFWSCRLYKAAAGRTLVRLIVVAGGAAFIVLIFIVAKTGSVAETSARVLTVMLAVLIATDELGVWLSYRSARAAAERTVGLLDHVDMGDLGTAAVVVADYATATAGAAPIPTTVYGREHDKIAQAWASRSTSSAHRPHTAR